MPGSFLEGVDYTKGDKVFGGRVYPGGRGVPNLEGIPTLPESDATAAVGTHSTGMVSCFYSLFKLNFLIQRSPLCGTSVHPILTAVLFHCSVTPSTQTSPSPSGQTVLIIDEETPTNISKVTDFHSYLRYRLTRNDWWGQNTYCVDYQCTILEFLSTCLSGRVTPNLTCPDENQLAKHGFES